MLTLRRVSPSGRRYALNQNYDGSTTIVLSDTTKHIKVNFGIDMLSQAWYNWQMKGELIQKAFSFLSNSQREFLITGITEEEWNLIFSQEEE